jgi:hypothetical protein
LGFDVLERFFAGRQFFLVVPMVCGLPFVFPLFLVTKSGDASVIPAAFCMVTLPEGAILQKYTDYRQFNPGIHFYYPYSLPL